MTRINKRQKGEVGMSQDTHLDSEGIPYRPAYRLLTGSLAGAILLEELECQFSTRPDGFFRFLEPAPNNRFYRTGGSWKEALAFSKQQFRIAFDRIGIRYKSKTAFEQDGTPFARPEGGEAMYASYTDHREGLTYYLRNHALADRLLEAVNSEVSDEGAYQTKHTNETWSN